MYEAKEEPKVLRVLRVVLGVAAALALVWGYYLFYTRGLGLELPKPALLRKSVMKLYLAVTILIIIHQMIIIPKKKLKILLIIYLQEKIQ